VATLTPNLKLVLENSLSATARANLLKIDTLGGLMNVDTTATAQIRSARDIVLVPNSPDVGGTGTGGTVQFGRAGQPLAQLAIFSESFESDNLSLKDTTSGSEAKLQLNFASGNALNTGTYSLELNVTAPVGVTLSLGGNLETTGGNLSLLLSDDSELTLPTTGTLATLDGAEAFSNKSLDALTIRGSGSYSASLDATAITESYSLQLPETAGLPGQILARTGTYGLEWLTVNVSQNGGELASVWTPALGGTVNLAHSLNSRQLLVQVLDTADNYATIEVTVKRLSDSVIQLNSTTTPPNDWLVLIKEIV